MHYYQFNIGDYASHTRHLDLLEDLAYRRLLDHYYLHEQPIASNFEMVARQIGMRGQADIVQVVLDEFFELVADEYVNQRADREIQAYRDKSEKASRAGKASAERRLNKRSTDVQPTNNQEPITNNQVKAPRGSRLPNNWIPDAELAAWSKSERPDLDLRQVLMEFRDYWSALAGAKAVKLDWDATWRNWVRKQNASKSVAQADVARATVPASVHALDSARRQKDELEQGKPPSLEQLEALAKLRKNT